MLVDSGLLEPRRLGTVRSQMYQTGTNELAFVYSEGLVAESPLFRALAEFHGLPFLATPEDWLEPVVEPAEIECCLKHVWVRLRDARGRTFVAAAPRDPSARSLRHLGVEGAAGQRVIDCIAPPSVVRALIDSMARDDLSELATGGLGHVAPRFSASRRLVPWQAGALAVLFAGSALGIWFAPAWATIVAGAIFGAVFFSVSVFRLAIFIAAFGPRRPCPALREQGADIALPVYTLLVPLYREAAIVPQTVAALRDLDYPRARLDIKLILEDDDRETRAALDGLDLPGCFEIVFVPKSFPRTKPKALNYALPRARGEFIAVFDAEDIPQPDQLRRAAALFAASPDNLACLQARLGIYNSRRSWLTRQFTIEYATQFEVNVPTLDRLGLPLMLCGTSNHFRAAALRAAGGWDAHNVTEDADLGIRLARLGFRCGWLDSTTLEEAAATPMVWFRQRRRWLRGWIQTYFVHMRNPLALMKELGPTGFLVFQAMAGGIALAALAYPVFLAQFAAALWTSALFHPGPTGFENGLLVVNAVNLLFGFCIVVELSILGLYRAGRIGLMWNLPLLPFYWLAISIAGYAAVWTFIRRPFHWEKTRHSMAGRHRTA